MLSDNKQSGEWEILLHDVGDEENAQQGVYCHGCQWWEIAVGEGHRSE